MLAASSSFVSHFVALLKPVFCADIRKRLLAILLAGLALKLSIVGLNVVNSFVNRYFINSLVEHDMPAFIHYAVLYLVSFATLSVVGSLATYLEEILGIRWREWFTGFFFNSYLSDHRYYHMQRESSIDNPDQRMSDDIHTFTGTTLSLGMICFDAFISLASFISVLWSITPWLVLAALCYAIVGSIITVVVGGRLMTLNHLQLQKEADFRYALIRLREHAEAIALLGGETGERRRLTSRLGRVVDNLRDMIAVNRNLRFFVAFYGYLNPVLPLLVVAPFYLSGQLTDFGAVTQSAVAFPFVLGAFSVLINQFGPIATLAAVTHRLGSMWEILQVPTHQSCVALELHSRRVGAQDVSMLAQEGGEILIKGLSFDLAPGSKLLVIGPQGVGKTTVFRALAGLECRGAGRIWRPAHSLFLPQRPYAPAGTLRQLLTYTARNRDIPDAKLIAVLQAVQFAPFLNGRLRLDDQQAWGDVLSISEQQEIAFARVLIEPPLFAFFDDALSALDDPVAQKLYGQLSSLGSGYVTFSERMLLAPYHDWILELTGNGPWRFHARSSSTPAFEL